MPNWSTEPPQANDVHPLRIVRTPAKGSIVAVVTCPGLVGCATHFVNNRTQPCEGTGKCEWCDAGHSWRWHGWVSAVLTNSFEHILFEMTATASDPIKNYYEIKQTVRGCHFTASRPSGRANGRVIIACKPADLARIKLPEPINVRKALCHIWGVQYQSSFDGRLDRKPFRTIGVDPGNGDARQRPGQPDPAA